MVIFLIRWCVIDNYRKLVRSLRTGSWRDCVFMNVPAVVVALEGLLRERGVRVLLCCPGSPDLPLCKSPIWRLRCSVGEGVFEVCVVGELVSVKRVIVSWGFNGESDISGYDGGSGGFSLSNARVVFVELANPGCVGEVISAMEGWYQ